MVSFVAVNMQSLAQRCHTTKRLLFHDQQGIC